MSNDLYDVLKLLPKLTKDELELVKKRVKGLASLSLSESDNKVPLAITTIDDDSMMFMHCVSSVLRSTGLEHVSYATMQSHVEASRLKANVPDLMKYFRESKVSRPQLIVLLQMGIEILCRDLARMRVPISFRSIMRNAHRIPSLMNREFPGYAQSGMLRFIVREDRKTGS
jgi:hypothetical protein